MPDTDPVKYFESEIKRLNYYNSQFLKEDDFRDEQLYHRQMRHHHNRTLHTWGIVSGLEVRRVQDARKVTVSRGTAIDRLGQEIVLPAETTVPRDNALPEEGEAVSFDNFNAGAQVYLTIKYREVFDQTDKDTKSTSKLYTRTTERPLLGLSATAPAADSAELVLAIIALDTNKDIANISPELRRYAGSRIGSTPDGREYSIYSDSAGNWHFFDASRGGDRLTVDYRGNVGINAASPFVRLSVNGPGANVYATDVWVENNMHVQGNEPMTQGGGRGRLRVGTAWGYIGVYAENSTSGPSDLVLGASSKVVRVGPGTVGDQHLIVPNGNVAVGRPAAGARLDVNGEVRATVLTIADGAGTVYPNNWFGMANNIDGATKWLHVGGITDAGERRLMLAATRTYVAGNVGIGTATPGFPLTFSNTLGDKISLWGQSGNHYGFGIQGALLQIHTDGAGSDIAFGYGASGALTETMRIRGSGLVGIGTPSPLTMLHLRRDAATALGPVLTLMNGGGGVGAGAAIDFDGYFPGTANPSARIQSVDDGAYSSSMLFLSKAPGANENTLQERMRISSAGLVGIGTAQPAGRLNITEASGTTHGPSGGTLVIDHENNGGASSIVFRSRVNRGSDYGFIQYQDADVVGGAGESARLIIGTSNDPDDHLILQPAGSVGLGVMYPADKLDIGGGLRVLTDSNPIRFTSGWSGFPDGANNRAEISNDTGVYKTLMIIGNKSGGLGRRVSVWDRLEVNGILTTTANLGVNVASPGFIMDVGGRARFREGGGTAGHWLFNEGADRAFIGMANSNQVGLWGNAGANWGLLMECNTANVTVRGTIGTNGFPATAKKAGWGGGIHTWDIEAEGTMWSRNGIDTSPHDVAENYLSDMDLAAGDVVCLDARENKIVLSERPNDPMLVGVISTDPGLLLDANHEDEPRPGGMLDYPVALCGRVPCKVTDENGPIRRGDLLTSSSTRGHAMKARPVSLGGHEFYPPGTIIGKALEAHESGRGVIEIFVALR